MTTRVEYFTVPVYTQLNTTEVNRKVKCTLVQALVLWTGRTAQRGSRGIALLFLDHGTRRGEGSASRPHCSLPPRKTWYALYRRLGGPQGRSGQVRNISPPPGFDHRTVQSVASRHTDYAIGPYNWGAMCWNITAYSGAPTMQSYPDCDIPTPRYNTKRPVRAAHEVLEGNRGTATFILNLDIRWRRVVSFTPRPLYSEDRTLVTIE